MTQPVAQSIYGGREPGEGRKYVAVNMDFSVFSSGPIPPVLNTTFNLQDSGMSQIAGIRIDNGLNPKGLWLTVQDTQQKISVMPGMQYTGPLYTGGLSVTISGATTGGVNIPISFLNFEPQIRNDRSPYLKTIGAYSSATGGFGASGGQYVAPNPVLTVNCLIGVWTAVLQPNPLRYGFTVRIDGTFTNPPYVGFGDQTGTISPGTAYAILSVNSFNEFIGPGDRGAEDGGVLPYFTTTISIFNNDGVTRFVYFREYSF